MFPAVNCPISPVLYCIHCLSLYCCIFCGDCPVFSY